MTFGSDEWAALNAFAEKVKAEDVIVTFNYDSTVERVLLNQSKWTPKDGYGTDLIFQKDRRDLTRVEFASSPVTVLHLHGSVGWYRKPHFRDDFAMIDEAGAVPREALTPAPLDTEISLDPLLLRGFGIYAVDASMPTRPPDEYQILLHPSFLKDYSGSNGGNQVFRRMWKLASEKLRAADKVAIVGYSLPPADTAAWALLLSSCDPAKTEIVNPDRAVMARYRRAFRLPVIQPTCNFQDWVKTL